MENPDYLKHHPNALPNNDETRRQAYAENTIEVDGVKMSQAEGYKVALSPETTWPQLQAILKSGNEDLKCDAVKNPNMPPEELTRLADDRDALIVASVADNRSTPPEVLTALANRELPGNNLFIHEAVAANPSTPVETLEKMAAESKNWHVIGSLAGNPATPDKVLIPFLDDKFGEDRDFNPEYQQAEVGIEVTPRAENLYRIRLVIVRRKSLSVEIARKLLSMGYESALAENRGTPREILEELLETSNRWLHETALYTLYPELDPINEFYRMHQPDEEPRDQ